MIDDSFFIKTCMGEDWGGVQYLPKKIYTRPYHKNHKNQNKYTYFVYLKFN